MEDSLKISFRGRKIMGDSKHLEGRTAIVTGATRGIGRAIAIRLAQEGANVAFNYMNNKELADSLKDEIETLGVKAMPFKVDIRNYDQVQGMKDDVLRELETFDILVNNAGIIKDGVLAMLSKEDWKDVIDTNLNGTYNASKAAVITFMKQKRGNIINITNGIRISDTIKSKSFSFILSIATCPPLAISTS